MKIFLAGHHLPSWDLHRRWITLPPLVASSWADLKEVTKTTPVVTCNITQNLYAGVTTVSLTAQS